MYLKKFLSKAVTLIENPILIKTLNKRDIRGHVKDLLLLKQILNFSPKTIFDIGAARGEWSQAARIIFPDARIYAFEPIAKSYLLMLERMKNEDRFHAFNFALADENAKVKFALNNFPDSSSILKMTEAHKNEFRQTEKEELIQIDSFRLDCLNEINIASPAFLKMDVQGAELLVLKGTVLILDKIDGIQLELNFENFYEQQATYMEIFNFMSSHSFTRFFQMGLITSSKSNKLLACDLIFVR